MNHLLHLVNKSPTEKNSFNTCLRMAKPGDSILMIEDGVYATLANADFAKNITSHLQDFSFYALGADIAARGLGDMALIKDVHIIDYEGFVDLVTTTDVTQSWL